MDKQILILHISDLHLGKLNPHSGAIEYFKGIFHEIENKLIEETIAYSDIDLVVFTGDMTSEASVSDFEHAKKFVKEILFSYFSKGQIIIIPGNHDLEWSKNKGKKHSLRFNRFLDFKNVLELRNENEIGEKYLDYPNFLYISDDTNTCIIGLNSCLYNAYDIDKRTPQDLKMATFNKDSKEHIDINYNSLLTFFSKESRLERHKYDFKIVLSHHNPTVIKDKDKSFKIINQLYEKGFSLILHGHAHKTSSHKYDDTLVIGAGSLFKRKDDEPDKKNQVSLIKLYKDQKIPILTRTDVLKINILYEKPVYDSVKLERHWESKLLECSENVYNDLNDYLFKFMTFLEHSNIKRSKENFLKIQEILSSNIQFNSSYLLDYFSMKCNDYVRKLERDGKINLIVSYIMKKYIEPKLPPKASYQKSKKSGNSKKKTVFAWSPIRRLMKDEGARTVARAAVDKLIEELESRAIELTSFAVDVAEYSNRNMLSKEDMRKAIDLIKND